MSEVLLSLGESDLREIAAAIRAKWVVPPYAEASLQRVLPSATAQLVSRELQQFTDLGFSAEQLAFVIELMAKDRTQRPPTDELVELVTTGPEAPGIANRDTSVVVRELFAHAQRSVMIAGYAVYQGQQVFRALADRMSEKPELQVRMFLDIQRTAGDSSAPSEVIRRFSERFKTREWPDQMPLPQVFYYPRSLEPTADGRSSLHAKCVVVDREVAFVSSANFTMAGHERNIEVGLLIRLDSVADRLDRHFQALADTGACVPVSI